MLARIVMSIVSFAMLLIPLKGELAAAQVIGDPASDDFERATLGSSWTIYNGNPHIVGGSDFGADPGLNIATWTANTFSADQFSECELSDPLDTTWIQVFVRRRPSDRQRYGFGWVPNSYPECGAGWSQTLGGVILKRDGGFGAPTLACEELPTIVGGDVIRVEVRDDVFTGYVNGEQVIQTTDLVLTEPGEPGMAMAPVSGLGLDQVGCESWRGGTLVPEPSPRLLGAAALLTLTALRWPALGRTTLTRFVKATSPRQAMPSHPRGGSPRSRSETSRALLG